MRKTNKKWNGIVKFEPSLTVATKLNEEILIA